MTSAPPTLDLLAGDWLAVSPPRNCSIDNQSLCRDSPVISSQLGSLGTNRDDLFSVNSLTLPPFAGGNFSGTIEVAGVAPQPAWQRWSAYEARRRSAEFTLPASAYSYSAHRGGQRCTSGPRQLVVESAVRLAFDAPVVMWEIRVRDNGEDCVQSPQQQGGDDDHRPEDEVLDVKFELAGLVRQLDAFPWILAYPFNTTQFTAAVVPSSPSPARPRGSAPDATANASLLLFADRESQARAAFGFAPYSASCTARTASFRAQTRTGTGTVTVSVELLGRARSPQPYGGGGDGDGIVWEGREGVVQLAMAVGNNSAGASALSVQRAVARTTAAFDDRWAASQSKWEHRWQSAFKAKNASNHTVAPSEFSGSLPLLVTSDKALRQLYYSSCLTLLSMSRASPALSSIGPHATLSAAGNYATYRFHAENSSEPTHYLEIGGAAQFYWDSSFHALLSSLLDPVSRRDGLLKVAEADIGATNWLDVFGRGAPSGHFYAFNYYTVFTSLATYAAAVPDGGAFLATPLPVAAGGGRTKTVAQVLEALATQWRERRLAGHNYTADYGGNRDEFLECVPSYIHAVPSLQAANAFMMRQVANMLEVGAGDDAERAAALRHDADEVVKALFAQQYVEGDRDGDPRGGVWCSLYPNGTCVEVRTCVDFVTIGYTLADQFTNRDDARSAMASQMGGFVQDELLTDNWMRALSLRDPLHYINRPDHGTTGAYDAWPSLTAEALSIVDGNWSRSLPFLRAVAANAGAEGPFGQAHALENENATGSASGNAFKTARGATRYVADNGGSFAETIVRNLFGYQPWRDWRRPLSQLDALLFRPSVSRGFDGELRHLLTPNGLATVTSSTKHGLRIALEP